ncbi:MAG: tetratricopeptide repeat protein [Desulfovibrionaceae bacterium]|nr:tetratricopeptide repeat protein [Desulfovibrionaceae bacterium]
MKSFIASILSLSVILPFTLATAIAAPDRTFQEWLEQYDAWDRLEHEYSQAPSQDSPENILKRAEVYLNLNSPEKALEIIEMTPSFTDESMEARRLWMGGQAQRALGDLSKAVLWFTQAGTHMEESAMRSQFQQEPGLSAIWQDVWLKMYWSYASNYTLSRDTQKATLMQMLDTARAVWGTTFWETAHSLLNPAPIAPAEASVHPAPTPEATAIPVVTVRDTQLIARSMALVSLEEFSDALTTVSGISSVPAKTFWTSIVIFVENGSLPSNLDVFLEGNYLKAKAFWAGNVLAAHSLSRSQWYLGNPDSGPWTKFRNNVLNMDFNQAIKAIDNELGSMLISEQTTTLLNSFKLALSLANGDFISSTTTWNKLNKKNLPITLRLAGMLAFKEDFKNVLPDNPAEAYRLYPVLSALSGAAGREVHERTDAPFWTTAQPDQLRSLVKEQYPLDRLLLLAYWQQYFADNPSVALAKRAAFLFDDTSFGIRSLIFLADDAVNAKKLQMGAFYLNRINEATLPPDLQVAWLDIKTRLELNSGRQATALTTYKEMVATGESIPVMTRLRMALLYQQRKEYKAAQAELLAMWDQRASMTTALQAETLFWLGEGEHAMGNTDKALDYYLRLAWQYPQENIWCLTAMYRASLIYEKRGKYETAKKLLGTVVRNASRKEQREAAKARIDAIERKMGSEEKDGKSTLVYPF